MNSKQMMLSLLEAANVVLQGLLITGCWVVACSACELTENNRWQFVLIFVLDVVFYRTFGQLYDAFCVSLLRVSELAYSQGVSLIMSDAVMYLVLCLMKRRLLNIGLFLVVLMIQFVIAIVWCYLSDKWYSRSIGRQKTAILYGRKQDFEGLIDLYGLQKRIEVCYVIYAPECIENNFRELQDVETVFLCGVNDWERNIVLTYCVNNGKTAYVEPCVGDAIMSGARQTHLFHRIFFQVRESRPALGYLLTKRLFDIAASLAGLALCLPLMLVVAATIKIEDGGSVFYCQRRLTKDGREFDMIKFRSMRQDAERDGVARLSCGDRDERVTEVGRIIRRFRIDELPQLVNVLGGAMSIVGPRPERPEIACQYEQELPEFALRLQVKAGLTGYAQVYGRYNTPPNEKLQMDLMYIAKASFMEDMKIIFATIKVLFQTESTQGVKEGMKTAAKRERNTEVKES